MHKVATRAAQIVAAYREMQCNPRATHKGSTTLQEQTKPTYVTPEELTLALRAGDETARHILDVMLASIGEQMKRAQQYPNIAILDVLQASRDGDIHADEAAEQVRAIAEKAHQSKQE